MCSIPDVSLSHSKTRWGVQISVHKNKMWGIKIIWKIGEVTEYLERDCHMPELPRTSPFALLLLFFLFLLSFFIYILRLFPSLPHIFYIFAFLFPVFHWSINWIKNKVLLSELRKVRLLWAGMLDSRTLWVVPKRILGLLDFCFISLWRRSLLEGGFQYFCLHNLQRRGLYHATWRSLSQRVAVKNVRLSDGLAPLRVSFMDASFGEYPGEKGRKKARESESPRPRYDTSQSPYWIRSLNGLKHMWMAVCACANHSDWSLTGRTQKSDGIWVICQSSFSNSGSPSVLKRTWNIRNTPSF